MPTAWTRTASISGSGLEAERLTHRCWFGKTREVMSCPENEEGQASFQRYRHYWQNSRSDSHHPVFAESLGFVKGSVGPLDG